MRRVVVARTIEKNEYAEEAEENQEKEEDEKEKEAEAIARSLGTADECPTSH